jgi:hypothetical protein
MLACVSLALLSPDQTTVDAAAARVPSVIDALETTVPEPRRAALAPVMQSVGTTTIEREGDAAICVLAAWCKRETRLLPRDRASSWGNLVSRIRVLMRVIESRPIGAWVWVELLGSIPSRQRDVATTIASIGELAYPVPAMRAAVWGEGGWRAMLFDRLERATALTLDDKLRALADPSLRASAETLLAGRVAEIEPRLRDMLDGASAGTQKAIVRLLRTLDAAVGLDGKVGHTSIDQLETRLRVDPRDAATAQVWADLMQEQGDPRGQALVLDMALAAERDPERALALSGELAALIAQHRKAIIGKPGGFPFREKYVGRGYIQFVSTWQAILRGKAETIRNKVTRYLARATTLDAPADPGVPPGPDERVRYLGTRLRTGEHQLVWPGTKIPLPYQEAGHYPEGRLFSTLEVTLESGRLELRLRFPFEDFSDPRFVAVYTTVADTLGRITLTASGFLLATPTADGSKTKFRKQRYGGPGDD